MQAHSKATGVSLVAEKKLSEAKTVEITEMVPNKQGLYLLHTLFLCNSKLMYLLIKITLHRVEAFSESLKVELLLLLWI